MKPQRSIKLGISSCLLGNNVRYDGGHKLDPYLRDTLGQFVEWAPICPERECGLPVPREAMDLVGGPDSPRLVTRVTGRDHTNRMMQWAHRKLIALEHEHVCGYVFKARSPSCAVHDAQFYAQPGRPVPKNRTGLFAEIVMRRFPLMPVEDEEGLQDPGIREVFLERVFAYQRSQKLLNESGTI